MIPENLDQIRDILIELSRSIDKLDTSKLDAVKKSLKDLGAEFDALTGKVTILGSSYDSVDDALKDMAVLYKRLHPEVEKTNKAMNDPAVKQYAEDYSRLQKSMREVTSESEGVKKTQNSLKAELRSAKAELSELTYQYNAMNSAEKSSAEGQALKAKMDELAKKAGSLKDAMNDANVAIKNVASDTAGLDALKQGMGALQASVQGVSSAYAIFGDENKEITKVMQKLSAVMGIVNTATTIQNALQKQSALSMALRTSATTANTTATTANAVATGALATTEGVATTATFSLTGALDALTASMLANPYTATLVAVTALIGGVVALANHFRSEREEAEENWKAHEEYAHRATRAYKEFADTVDKKANKAITDQTAHYMSLRAQWVKAKGNLKEQNRLMEELKKSGLVGAEGINSINDANDYLINNKDLVIETIKAEAYAMAQQEKLVELYKKQIDASTQPIRVQSLQQIFARTGDIQQVTDKMSEPERKAYDKANMDARERARKAGKSIGEAVEIGMNEGLAEAQKVRNKNAQKENLGERKKIDAEINNKVDEIAKANAKVAENKSKITANQSSPKSGKGGGAKDVNPNQDLLDEIGNDNDRLAELKDKLQLATERGEEVGGLTKEYNELRWSIKQKWLDRSKDFSDTQNAPDVLSAVVAITDQDVIKWKDELGREVITSLKVYEDEFITPLLEGVASVNKSMDDKTKNSKENKTLYSTLFKMSNAERKAYVADTLHDYEEDLTRLETEKNNATAKLKLFNPEQNEADKEAYEALDKVIKSLSDKIDEVNAKKDNLLHTNDSVGSTYGEAKNEFDTEMSDIENNHDLDTEQKQYTARLSARTAYIEKLKELLDSETLTEQEKLKIRQEIDKLSIEQAKEKADEEVRIAQQKQENIDKIKQSAYDTADNVNKGIQAIEDASDKKSKARLKAMATIQTASTFASGSEALIHSANSIWKDPSIPSVYAKIAMISGTATSLIASTMASIANIKKAGEGQTGSFSTPSCTAIANTNQTVAVWNTTSDQDTTRITDAINQNGGTQPVLVLQDLNEAQNIANASQVQSQV